MTDADIQTLIDEGVNLLKQTTTGYAGHNAAWQNNQATKWWQGLDKIGQARHALGAVAPAPAPAPPSSSTATEFRLGDPAKGWDANSQTSAKWTRQAGVPAHVSFSLEKWFGDWQVIDCLVSPSDPPDVGMSGQRAQIIHDPPVGGLVSGVGKWISVAFRAGANYKPQSKTAFPNWNAIGLCIHDTAFAVSPQAPFGMNVCTMDPNLYPYAPLPAPHLMFSVYGGALPDSNWYSKGKRFLGPAFVPGHIYVADIYYLPSHDPLKGQFEAWIDGAQVVPRQTLATTWTVNGADVGLYFNLENYRPVGSEITWDNVLSWCGLRVADTRAEATFLA